MKLLTIALLLFSTTTTFAYEIEVGTYRAVDVESGTIITTLLTRADKTVNFKVKTPDFEMAEPGCEGTYVVNENVLVADMKCPMEGMEQIQVRIDISKVTAELLRQEPGATVDVSIDALGADPYKFYLKKLN